MQLIQLEDVFSICQLSSTDSIDLNTRLSFLSVTDDEVSYVCPTNHIPANALKVENSWKGLKIDGVLDFGMVGVLAKIADLLAQNEISIFVISTYNTDYIFIKESNLQRALQVLTENAYRILHS